MGSSIAEEMRSIRLDLFEAIGERLIVGAESVPGKFYRRHREIPTSNGTLVGIDIAFDCETCAAVEALQAGASVSVAYPAEDGTIARTDGPYRYERTLLRGGDESGLVILQLATFKA